MEQKEYKIAYAPGQADFSECVYQAAKEAGLQKECRRLIENGMRLMAPFFALSGGSTVIRTDGKRFVIRFLGKFDRSRNKELALLFAGGEFSAPSDGLLKTFWSRLVPVVRDGALGKEPRLTDGVMHFGILANTGYYWSLADSENRRQYHDDKSTDRLKDAVLSHEERELSDLRLIYDNGELELELYWKL